MSREQGKKCDGGVEITNEITWTNQNCRNTDRKELTLWERKARPSMGVSVCQGCRNQVPQTGWLKLRTSAFLQFRRWKCEVKKDAAGSVPVEHGLPGLQTAALSVPLLGLS